MNKKKEIIVSNEFVEIYLRLNVFDQVDNIKKLSEFEKYLLLVVSLDNHDPENLVFKNNIKPFKDELMAIYNMSLTTLPDVTGNDNNTNPNTNPYILELIRLTGKNLDINLIRNSGNSLPKLLDADEIRDLRLGKILE